MEEQNEEVSKAEDLTQPDQVDFLEGLTPEECTVAKKLLPALAESANKLAREAKAKELASELKAIMDQNKVRMEETLLEIRKANTPLSADEVSTLLSQEYAEFTFKFNVNGSGTSKDFVIRELPSLAEKRLMKTIRSVVVSRMEELARIDWNSGDGLQRLASIIDVVPGALEALADCVAICLDPYEEDSHMTGEWVQRHFGANRILNIVNAQVQASRYRDFFSLAYRMYQQRTTR